ncbi:hypothetical protein P409_23125 [Inquilinus limosus MP06]|uniref:Uncharacterized protein n=1 Tax=Inquilinus limosus MP06 TaxID=1398085 RepID=A0A0A0D4Z8_9PROT|nr:hypothetical protein P409_23125 [Inquilinus limosus MP06]
MFFRALSRIRQALRSPLATKCATAAVKSYPKPRFIIQSIAAMMASLSAVRLVTSGPDDLSEG